MKYIEYVIVMVTAIMTIMFTGAGLYSAMFLSNMLGVLIGLMALVCIGLLYMYKMEAEEPEEVPKEKGYWDYHRYANDIKAATKEDKLVDEEPIW